MKDGYCHAGQPTMAELTGLNERTLRRWIQKLEDRGWLKDLDAGVQGRPHRIVTTNKVELVMELRAAEQDRTESPNSETSDRESEQIGQRIRTDRTESPNRSDRGSDKETIGDEDKRREKKNGAAAPFSANALADEMFEEEQKQRERARPGNRGVKRFRVGSDPVIDIVKASDLAKQRSAPGWAVLGPEGLHPAFPVVHAFCELIGRSIDTLGRKSGETLLRHYAKLAEEHSLTFEHMAEAHHVLRGKKWGDWHLENHNWSTGYEQSYVGKLVLAAGQIRDGTLNPEGDPPAEVPYSELTGLDMVLARKRQRKEQLEAEGKPVPRGLFDQHTGDGT
jgi:hypothetical protein